MLKCKKKYPKNIFLMLGLHPVYVDKNYLQELKFVKNEKLFEEDFKVNNFPCKFMKSLFDIETCSNEFKNSFLMRKMSFDMLRESFNFVDDFSCYKLNKSSKNDNNLLKKFLPMEKIN